LSNIYNYPDNRHTCDIKENPHNVTFLSEAFKPAQLSASSWSIQLQFYAGVFHALHEPVSRIKPVQTDHLCGRTTRSFEEYAKSLSLLDEGRPPYLTESRFFCRDRSS